uniref:Xeroderma pigmentosum, complementation group C n=1 Tax=Erpetoichthys calabaricus TaxID=27687 RepID=A0A8C4T638_ERPCA
MAPKRRGSVDACAKAETKRAKGPAVKKTGSQRKMTDANDNKVTVGAKQGRKNSKVARELTSKPKKEDSEINSQILDQMQIISFSTVDHGDNSSGEEPCLKAEEEEEESEDEWQEVEELTEPVSFESGVSALSEPVLPSKPVEIEIETPEQARKRQKREKRKAEFETYLRRMMNRFSKDLQVETHKVHLLCLLANGFFRNRVCNEPDLHAIALSIIPTRFTQDVPEKMDLFFLSNLAKWFTSAFVLNPHLSLDENENLQVRLEKRFAQFAARDTNEMTHIFLIILRALRLFCRLVISLQPISIKSLPGKKNLSSANKEKPEKKELEESKVNIKKEDDDMVPLKIQGVNKRAATGTRSKKMAKKQRPSDCKDDKSQNSKEALQKTKNNRLRKVASKVSYKEDSDEQDGSDSDFQLSHGSDSSYSEGEKEKEKKTVGGSRGTSIPAKRKSFGKSNKEKKESSKQSKVLSEDDEELDKKGMQGTDQWVEVYLERFGKWSCIDCMAPSVNQPQNCFKHATKPVKYIVGFDNNNFVKDVTRRYDPAWMTSTRKLRVSPEWWEETLLYYQSPITEREKKEDQQLQTQLLDQPLPASVSEYKNHPLYALERHILKYEAIYPPTATVLGYCRGEAVYSRDCVHTLHSRDTWLKEAKVVKLGEVPYKMVKGFSNRARKARMMEAESREKNDLGLFGLWQTEEYQPPVAVDGKVPRNDYGNVYLFRPCMLPIGCVHLQVPNLHKVARKLEIDCAPAVTGFDFHCGFSHPVVDGYVVCEEFKEVLLAAWENEQVEIERKQQEKREKRVLANWTLLTKGLLIKERLKKRYQLQSKPEENMGDAAGDGFSSDEEVPNSQTTATDVASSWPQNRQGPEGKETLRKTKREKKGEEKHLFPFEKL